MKKIFPNFSIKNALMQLTVVGIALLLFGNDHALGSGMALVGLNVAGGESFNLPNFIGEIFTASPNKTPILAMSGGLNGYKTSANFNFAIDQEYTAETATQTAISETTAIAGPPTAVSLVRSQVENTCQIEQEQISLSYKKMASAAKLSSSGVLTVGTAITPTNEMDWQTAKKLELVATKMEYSILRGTYVKDTAVGTASKTRGLNEAALTTQAAGGAQLSKTMMDKLLRDMWTAGAQFKNPILVLGVYQKQQISKIYGYAPTDRNVGGVNIKQIETDVGNIGIMLSQFQTSTTLLLADMAFVSVVTSPVPGKGNFFVEPLAKVGAAELKQLYGQWGLDHGPYFMHGTITGLANS